MNNDIETMLVMALEGFNKPADKRSIDKVMSSVQESGSMQLMDQGDFLGFDEALPDSMFTFDFHDEDRLLSSNSNDLLQHPKDIIGDESQFFMLAGDICKFYALRKLSKRPKGVAVLGKVECYYEFHCKLINLSGGVSDYKRVIPFNKRGQPLTAKLQNSYVCSPLHEGAMAVICCSMIEDARRTNAVLASISEQCELKMPVSVDSYKELFALRDDPRTASGRRKAIIHWVSSHVRKYKSGKSVKIDEFNRGITEFDFDGLKVKLEVNTIDRLIGAAL